MHSRPDLVELSLDADLRCPSCRDSFRIGEPIVVCPRCRTVVHGECLGKDGRCTTFGCANGAPLPPLPWPRRRRVAVAVAAALVLGSVAATFALVDGHEPPGGCLGELPLPVRSAPPAPVVFHVPAEPVRPTARTNVTVRLRVPTWVSSSEVLIAGSIEGAGPLRVSVRAPGGRAIAWEAFEPGPFATGVTLPARGVHRIEVVVQDVDGAQTVTEYTVLWR